MASIKKKSSGGGANWMDTYGDMVTLLLCFFVLLYSISTIDQTKWMLVVKSFNRDAVFVDNEEPTGPMGEDSQGGGNAMPIPNGDEVEIALDELYEFLEEYALQQNAANQNSISVSQGDGFVFVSFDDAVFFDGDRSYLRQDGKDVLDGIIPALIEAGPYIDELKVLGHTAQADPNEPNNIIKDRHLASDRATEVVIYFQQHISYEALNPGRYVAEGFGQWRNVAPNDTSENRAKNRRVELIISGRDVENALNDDYRQYYTMSDDTTGNTTSFTTQGNAAISYTTGDN